MRGFCLEVTGDYACFTRPEMKVERVSYDVITPSSARAIFEAILWKPAIRWQVSKIEVLAPIRWTSVRRNEVSKVASPRAGSGIFVEDERQQRASLILQDVKYRLWAEFEFLTASQRPRSTNPSPEWLGDAAEKEERRQDESPAKYAAMFERRARKGQCFNQPYLGCREFSCREIKLVDPAHEPSQPEPSLGGPRDLGFMLYDMDYADPKNVRPLFYRPTMTNGVIIVPHRTSKEVLG